MLGINYESSDEDDAVTPAKIEVSHAIMSKEDPIATNIELSKPISPPAQAPETAAGRSKEPSAQLAPVTGPAQGPSVSLPLTEDEPTDDVPPGSPYTSNRLMIQNLTLPTVPNWNIPPSPPGSPPQKSTKKFAQFLELKKKGQHFNQRLEGSTVLRDPSHLRKLMDFAGIDEVDQYASTLPKGLDVPVIWPKGAYAEELNASQRRIARAKEEEKSKVSRESIDFVPSRSGVSSGTGTPSGKGSRQSTAERVMAGLDRQQSSRSSSQSAGKRKDLEHRGRREESSRNRWRSRSRSPKRRRSRSRERL